MEKITLEIQNLITFEKAATRLNVSRPTIYNWIDRGLLHPLQIEGRHFLFASEVEGLNKACHNCYHAVDSLCSCREPQDMIRRAMGCSDWVARTP